MCTDAWPHYTDRNERKALSVITFVYAVGKKKCLGSFWCIFL